MSEDQFTKLFKYMQREFTSIRLEQTASKEELNNLLNAVDAYAKQTETYMQEMLALGHQVDRHDKWIHKIAKATEVELSA